MTTDKPSLPKDWPYANNCILRLLSQREQFARQHLFAGADELTAIGIDSDEITSMCEDHLMDFDDYGMSQDEVDHSLLTFPFATQQPWETCHPACRTTVEFMQDMIESAHGVAPEGRALYDRWIASGMSGQALVATIKHECGLDLSPDEQIWMALSAYREYRKGRDKNWSSYLGDFADDHDA
jgi:hypothetical protein